MQLVKIQFYFLVSVLFFAFTVNVQAQEVMWTRVQSPSGQLLEDFQVLKKKKKIRHGKYRKYYHSGQVNIIGNYSYGVLNGEWKSLHYDGGLAVSGAYLDGEWIGNWNYYDLDSTLCVVGNYENNKRVGKWSFIGEDGFRVRLGYEAGLPNGVWEIINQDTLIATCSFLEGEVEEESFKIISPDSVLPEDTVYTVPEYPAVFFMLNYNNHHRTLGPDENEPMFAMGMEAFSRYLQDYVMLPKSVFPSRGQIGKPKSTCYLQVVINQVGVVEGVEVIRSFNKDLDKELKRIIMAMPMWVPAINEGIPVKSMITVPYTFNIVRR